MLLHIHTDVGHPPGGRGVDGQGVRQGGGGKPNKIVTPKLETRIGPDEFSFWKEKWDMTHTNGPQASQSSGPFEIS